MEKKITVMALAKNSGTVGVLAIAKPEGEY